MKNLHITILLMLLFPFSILAQHSNNLNVQSEPSFSTTEERECYCTFFNEFYYYNNYIAQIAQAYRNQWFSEQKEVLKDEIQDRMNKTYNSFEDAQFDFFKENFATNFAENYLDSFIQEERLQKIRSYSEYSNTYVPRRIFQLAQNNASYNFEGLSHYNKSLESMTLFEAQNLFNQYNTYNANFENDWEYHHNRYKKLLNVESTEAFVDYLTNEYVDDVNSNSLEDRVSIMTGYLIYEAQDWYGPQVPYASFAGFSFYSPENYNYSNPIEYLMNNSNVHYEDINSLSMTFDELKREYSTTSMNLLNNTGGYLKTRPEAREKVGIYLERNNYAVINRNRVRDVYDYYRGEEDFATGNEFNGTQSWGQDSDREDIIASITLSNTVLNSGYYHIGQLLEAFSEASTDYTQKGKLIRRFLSKNTNFTLPSTLSDSDYGKLFDFENGGCCRLELKFSEYALGNIIEMRHGDGIYGWSLFQDDFKIRALEALANGDKVDFKERQIFLQVERLCGSYAFSEIGNALIGNITNLGFDMITVDPNTNELEQVTVSIPNLCIGVPKHWTTASNLSREVSQAYNLALGETFALMNVVEPDVTITTEWAAEQLRYFVEANFNVIYLPELLNNTGAIAVTRANCLGAPITQAQWCQ